MFTIFRFVPSQGCLRDIWCHKSRGFLVVRVIGSLIPEESSYFFKTKTNSLREKLCHQENSNPRNNDEDQKISPTHLVESGRHCLSVDESYNEQIRHTNTDSLGPNRIRESFGAVDIRRNIYITNIESNKKIQKENNKSIFNFARSATKIGNHRRKI